MNIEELSKKFDLVYEIVDKKLKDTEKLSFEINKKSLDIQCKITSIECEIESIKNKIECISNNNDSEKKEIIKKELENLLVFIKSKDIDSLEDILSYD